MHFYTDPTIARLNAEAFRHERMCDAAQYRVGEPSGILRLVGGFGARIESLGRAAKSWSQAESSLDLPAARRNPTAN